MKKNMAMNVTEDHLKNLERKDEIARSHIHTLCEAKLNAHSVCIM